MRCQKIIVCLNIQRIEQIYTIAAKETINLIYFNFVDFKYIGLYLCWLF